MNVETGKCRVDLAAIAPDLLVLVEIKSRKDTLDRLPEQVRIFGPACHRLVVCYAAERWDYSTVSKSADWSVEIWPDNRPEWWSIGGGFKPPNTSAMLNLLWRDELYWEASRAGFQPHKRESRSPLMRKLWDGLTGRQVVAAVCRQLRARRFAEADPPIVDA